MSPECCCLLMTFSRCPLSIVIPSDVHSIYLEVESVILHSYHLTFGDVQQSLGSAAQMGMVWLHGGLFWVW